MRDTEKLGALSNFLQHFLQPSFTYGPLYFCILITCMHVSYRKSLTETNFY